MTMSTLSPRGRALVRAGRRAFQPTEADRVRLLGALTSRLGALPCRPTSVRCRPQPLRAEKSLFDLAMWVKEYPELMETLLKEPAGQICKQLSAAEGGAAWDELRRRFATHLAEYGHTIYDLDFAKPVPADDPVPLVESLKDIKNLKGGE